MDGVYKQQKHLSYKIDRERLALFGSVSPIRFIPLFMAILCRTECLELPLKLLLEGA